VRVTPSIWAGLWLGLALAGTGMAADSATSPPDQTAREQVTLLALGVTGFQRDVGRFPTREEGLAVLLQPPAGTVAERWHGPYLEQPPGLVPDPWGHAYVYDVRPTDPERPFTIYSCGADGVSTSGGNDADDVRLWPDAEPPTPEEPAAVPLGSPTLRSLRGPLGLILVLTIVLAYLKRYVRRNAVRPTEHPGGYVRRHLRRGRHGHAETPETRQGS